MTSRKRKNIVRVESWWVSSIVELIDKTNNKSQFNHPEKLNKSIQSVSSINHDEDDDFFGWESKNKIFFKKLFLFNIFGFSKF